MKKNILITGSTDGIGLLTAERLVEQGHHVLLHGRSTAKLEATAKRLSATGSVDCVQADLSRLDEVDALAGTVTEMVQQLDVLINNAGVFKTANPLLANGQDVRFVVNTIAPYLLTKRLLPLIGKGGRVVNLSSAAQAPVKLQALSGTVQISDDFQAYAQSKLAITTWSRHLAEALPEGPVIVSVNPGSLLGTKMVREGFGTQGNDVGIGADILIRAALSDEFANASGAYFDNDARQFSTPHPEGLDPQKSAELIRVLDALIPTT